MSKKTPAPSPVPVAIGPALAAGSFGERLDRAMRGLDVQGARGLMAQDPQAAKEELGRMAAGLYSTVPDLTRWPDWSTDSYGRRDGRDKEKELSSRKAREMLDACAGHGLDLRAFCLGPLVESAASGQARTEDLDWLLARGAFDEELRGRLSDPSTPKFCESFLGESEAGIATLGRLVDAGAVRDGPGELGLTDFLARGLFKCAQLLAERGFEPRALVAAPYGFAGFGTGDDPVTATAAGALSRLDGMRRQGRGGEEAAKLPEAVEMMKWVAVLGARPGEPVVRVGPGGEGGPAGREAADPFERLAWAAGDAPAKMVSPLFKALKRLGGDPDATGGYLACELARARGDLAKNWPRAQLALDLGARPADHPGLALAACLGWNSEALSMELLDKVAALGADPAKCEKVTDMDCHPIAKAFSMREFGVGWRLAEMGAGLDWEDAKTGENLVHMLARRSGPKNLAQLSRLLALPAAAELLDARAWGGDWPGQTPLMRACRAMSPSSVEALLAAGADPNAKDGKGRTPLLAMAGLHNKKAQAHGEAIVSMLLAAGADPGVPDRDGELPLHKLAARGSLGAVSRLVEARAEDVAGPAPEAKKAKEALSKRGGRASSLVERAEIEHGIGKSREPSAAGDVSGSAARARRPGL